jgi:acyl carrier protein
MSQVRQQIRDRLNVLFQQVFMDDTISIFDEMSAKDVEDWDSISHITLVVGVEREFGVRLRAADVGRLKNVGDMIDLLEKMTA